MTTIVTKNGSGAPLASDLVQGELAVDLTNKRLYTENSGGSVIELGSNPTSLTTGTFTSTGIDDNATSTAITIDASENVGIGTTSPDRQLRVLDGGARNTSTAFETTVAGSFVAMHDVNSTSDLSVRFGALTDDAVIYAGNTERMRIDSSGNVGIGTTSPDTNLDVSFGAATVYSSSTTQDPSVIIQNTTGADGGYSSLRIQSRNSNGGTPTSFSEIANVSTNSANYRSNMVFKTKNASNVSVERMRIDINGNVGIGTISPTTELEVENTGSVALTIHSNDNASGNDAILNFQRGTNQTWGADIYQDWRIRDTVGELLFEYAASGATAEAMRIGETGNLGIGTTSPRSKLSFGTSALDTTPTDISALALYDNGSTIKYGLGVSDSQLNYKAGLSSDSHVWYAGTTERMRINNSGNVGIGTDTPESLLSLGAGTSTTGTFIKTSLALRPGWSSTAGTMCNTMMWQGTDVTEQNPFGSANTTTEGVKNFYAGLVSSNAFFNSPRWSLIQGGVERLSVDTSGNLLVGTTSTPSGSTNGAALMANNQIIASRTSAAALALYRPDSNGDVALFHKGVTQVGSISVTGLGTAYNTSSDQRLKENIVDAPAGNIDAIRVRSFDWKADGSHQTYGMVAQELVDVAPEAVSQGATEDDMWGVDYSKLVPMLVKEIQDLRARVAQLEEA